MAISAQVAYICAKPAFLIKVENLAFDPEGIATTLPAIVQAIFGYLVGNYISQKGKTYEIDTLRPVRHWLCTGISGI